MCFSQNTQLLFYEKQAHTLKNTFLYMRMNTQWAMFTAIQKGYL